LQIACIRSEIHSRNLTPATRVGGFLAATSRRPSGVLRMGGSAKACQVVRSENLSPQENSLMRRLSVALLFVVILSAAGLRGSAQDPQNAPGTASPPGGQ